MYEWGTKIITASVAFGIAEMILPQSNISKYCKLAFSIILLLLIANPITSLLKADNQFDSKFAEYMRVLEEKASQYQSYNPGQSLNDSSLDVANVDKIAKVLQEKLIKHVYLVAQKYNVEEIDNVDVEIVEDKGEEFGTVLEVSFEHSALENEKIKKVIEQISKDFKISKQYIKVEGI